MFFLQQVMEAYAFFLVLFLWMSICLLMHKSEGNNKI